MCGKEVWYKENLYRHMNAEHFGKKYECKICKKVCYTANDLRKHKLKHSVEMSL